MNQWSTKNLDELFDIGGEGLVSELIRMFIDEGAIIIQKLDEYLRQNQQEAIGQMAHKLKSSSGSLGLIELSEQCRKIEFKFKNSEIITSSDIEQMIQKIQSSNKLLTDYKFKKN